MRAVSALARSRSLVTQPKQGWLTVYDETSESQDLAEVRRIAKGLSSKLATDALAFLLHDSDVFVYLAYRKGKLVDQFNSRPDYFGEATASERRKWAGDFKKLLPLAPRGVTFEKIQRVLAKKHVFQEQLVTEFSQLMGIDPKRAGTGFRYLQETPRQLRLVHGRGHSPQAAALIAGADKGDLEKVRELLAQGISPNQKSRYGESILASAIRFHKKEIALALIEAGADPYSPPETNAIWAAAAHGEREILAKLLEKNSPGLKACLPAALNSGVQMGYVEIVGDLLKAGADPNAPSANGFTPLMGASFRGYEVMWEIVFGREIPAERKRTGWAAIVTQLLDAGADVNARSSNGMTALMMARASGQKEIVEILERAGADTTLRPSGPEFEKLAEAFRTQKEEGAETDGAAKAESLAEAARSGRAHLNPRVRDVILERMKMNQCKADKKDE